MTTPLNLKDAKIETDNITFTIYGQAGTGKTNLLRGMPRPLFVFDLDHKLVPLYGMSDIEGISIDVAADMDKKDGSEYTSFMRTWKVVKKDEKFKNGTIAFDSMSRVDSLFISKILMETNKNHEAPSQAEYGILLRRYDFFLNEIAVINDRNIVLICHEDIAQDELSKVVTVGPALSGSTRGRLPSFMKEVYRTKTREQIGGKDGKEKQTIYIVQYKPDGMSICRSGMLPSSGSGVIEGFGENPSYAQIMQLAKGKK